jgi:ubiquinone/menaquinone biosynthesis C-methylase UbiE
MNMKISKTKKIDLFSNFNKEPFNSTRDFSRLLNDFSILISQVNLDYNHAVLDFGAGSCWLSEYLVKMGFNTVSFDIHDDLYTNINNIILSDRRINTDLFHYQQGDAHQMPFEDNTFSNIFCFDTLHHMKDFDIVLSEMHRILTNGGKALFAEPGARHAESKETIEFITTFKKNEPEWIERSIFLEEIDLISKKAGFIDGLTIIPMQHTLNLYKCNLETWTNFRNNQNNERFIFNNMIADINYFERVIFTLEK